jgi:hypothetical protein
MLGYSLILTAILLGVTIAVARRPPEPVGWSGFLATGVCVNLGGLCLIFFPPVVLSCLFLGEALGVWTFWRSPTRRFWPMGLTAVVLAYLVMGIATVTGRTPYGRYREQFPFESMTERVPEPSADRILLPSATQTRLALFEETVERHNHMRSVALRDLHEDRVREFVGSPGFGVARLPSPTYWLRTRPRDPPPPQSVEWPSTEHGSPAGPTAAPDSSSGLADMHHDGVLDFLNLAGFGYAKDRTQVAGFQPHGFSRGPTAPEKWTVDRIELVSLLIRPEPVVYMTATLPTMEGVREFPTRPLDEFETTSLKLLRAGEDITSAAGPEVTRAFGSIRSTKHCVSCHGGQRGDLLGAFSYVLREDKAKRP